MAATGGPASPTRSAASPRATTPQPSAARSGPAPLRRRRIKVVENPLHPLGGRGRVRWASRAPESLALGVPPGFKGREAIVHYLAEDVGGRLFRDGKVDVKAVVADGVASSSNRCSRRPCATGVLTERPSA